jgi:ribosomal protein L32
MFWHRLKSLTGLGQILIPCNNLSSVASSGTLSLRYVDTLYTDVYSTALTHFRSLIPSLNGTLARWLAVPKRKHTPMRRGNRRAHKYITFVPTVSQCSKCSKVFMPHEMPSHCHKTDCPAFSYANISARPTDENGEVKG